MFSLHYSTHLFIKNNSQVLFTYADKGNTVAFNKEDYMEKWRVYSLT